MVDLVAWDRLWSQNLEEAYRPSPKTEVDLGSIRVWKLRLAPSKESILVLYSSSTSRKDSTMEFLFRCSKLLMLDWVISVITGHNSYIALR